MASSNTSDIRPFTRGRFRDLPETPRRSHDLFSIPSRQVTVPSKVFGDVSIFYRELGSGPPLLLIHGLMTSSYSWRYVIRELARDFRVIAPDLPGSGASDKPARRYTADAYATFILELQQALDIRGCLAIGNSLGGYLCMQSALKDDRAFAKLINIHSPGVPEPRLRALHIGLSIPGMKRLVAWWIQRDPIAFAFKNVHYFDESLKSLEEAKQYGAPLASKDGVRAFLQILFDVLAPRDVSSFVSTLRARRDNGTPFPMPLFFIYSRVDPMVPPRVGEKLHALVPTARFEWLEHTSHFAHVDSPDRVIPLVRSFLV